MRKFGIFLAAMMLVGCDSFTNLSDIEHVDRAEDFIDGGQLKAASIELKNALEKNRSNIKARWLLGKLYIDISNGIGAEKELRESLKLGMPEASISPYLARALLLQGKNWAVLKLLPNAEFTSSQRAELLASRAKAHQNLGEESAFNQEIESALLLDPTSIYAKAVKAGVEVGKIDQEQAKIRFAQAQKYLSEGKIKAAVQELKAALLNDPLFVSARLLLGETYLAGQHGAAAEKELGRAAKLEAPRDQWLVSYGQALLWQDKFKQILNRIDISDADSDGDKAQIYALRGQSYSGLKRLVEARESLEKALALKPDLEHALFGMARVSLQEQKHEESVRWARQAQELYPDNLRGTLILGEALRYQRNFVESAEVFASAIKMDPTSIQARISLATTEFSAGHISGAQQSIRKALSMDGDSVAANYLSGMIAARVGNDELAEDRFLKVFEKAPKHPQANLMYGFVQYRMGNFERAKVHVDYFLQVKPGYIPAILVQARSLLNLNEVKSSIHLLEPLMVKLNSTPRYLALLASAYTRDGNYEKGNKLFEKAIKLDPEVAVLRTQLAAGYMAAGESESAINALIAASKLEPSDRSAPAESDTLLFLAYLKEENTNKAVQYAQTMAARFPKSPVPKYLLGKAALKQQEPDKAKAFFEQALKLDSAFSSANLSLASLAAQQNKVSDAEILYKRVLDTNPSNTTALMGLAVLAIQRDDGEAAERWLVRANELHPTAVRPADLLAKHYLRTGEVLKALSIARTAYDAHPNSLAAIRLMGIASLRNEDYSTAIVHFKASIQRDPDGVKSLGLLAEAEFYSGDLELARVNVRKVLALDSGNISGLLLAAKIDLASKRLSQALAFADAAVQGAPDQSAGYLLKGDILQQMQKSNLSISTYKEGYTQTSNYRLARKAFEGLVASGRRADGYELLTQWLIKSPQDAGLRMVLAIGYKDGGKPQQAIQQYEILERQSPNNIVLLNNLAWAYNELDDKRAISISARAYELAPDSTVIADTYGWVLLSQGQHSKGLAVLEEARNRAPKNTDIRYHLALGYEKTGRHEEAKRLLNQLLSDNSEFSSRADAEALSAQWQ